MNKDDIIKRRKKFMDHLSLFMNTIDPSGENAKHHEEYLNAMSDAQFDKWVREFKNDPTHFTYLEMVEYEREITIEKIVETAEKINVPLVEEICYPYQSGDSEDIIMTPTKVPVGYLHIDRMPQTLIKKSTGSTKIEKRSPLTGQVTGDDKNARNSNLETFSLITLNAMNAAKEFLGPRADNMLAKNQMYNEIAKNGYTSLEELDLTDPYYKVALNTWDMYYIMMGIKTNLITDEDKLPGPR